MGLKNRFYVAIGILISAIILDAVCFLKGDTDFMIVGIILSWISIALLITSRIYP